MGSKNSKQKQKEVFVYFLPDTLIERALAKERKQHLTVCSILKKRPIESTSSLSSNGMKI